VEFLLKNSLYYLGIMRRQLEASCPKVARSKMREARSLQWLKESRVV